MKTLRQLSLQQRVGIGNYYKDGMKAKNIAPLYGTSEKEIQNVISYLRTHGVQIPYKRKHSKHSHHAKKTIKPSVNEPLIVGNTIKKERSYEFVWFLIGSFITLLVSQFYR